MDLNLKGKVILVTGGAGGIGAAICRACGQELAVPVILDRDADAAHQLQSKLQGEGITSEVIVVELTELSDVRTAVETVGDKLGRIDGVVNNAGSTTVSGWSTAVRKGLLRRSNGISSTIMRSRKRLFRFS